MRNRLFHEKGKNKPNDEHLEDGIYDKPQKAKYRIFVACAQFFGSHGPKKFEKMLYTRFHNVVIIR